MYITFFCVCFVCMYVLICVCDMFVCVKCFVCFVCMYVIICVCDMFVCVSNVLCLFCTVNCSLLRFLICARSNVLFVLLITETLFMVSFLPEHFLTRYRVQISVCSSMGPGILWHCVYVLSHTIQPYSLSKPVCLHDLWYHVMFVQIRLCKIMCVQSLESTIHSHLWSLQQDTKINVINLMIKQIEMYCSHSELINTPSVHR